MQIFLTIRKPFVSVVSIRLKEIADLTTFTRTSIYNYFQTKEEIFYCIQGNTHGEEAILIWLSPDENDVAAHPYVDDYVNPEAYKYLPTVAEAQKVLDIFNDDIRFWNKMLAEMDKRNLRWSWKYGVWTTGNDEFLLNEYNSEKRLIKCLDLDQSDEDDELGRICDIELDDYYRYRYLRIRIFPPAN